MKNKDLKERLIKNSFWSFGVIVINRVGMLIFTILLARLLMPEGYGIYSIVLSVAMIFYTFTDVGINQTLVRYISFALVEEKKKIPAYHRYLLKLKLILLFSSSLLLIILSYPLSFYIFKNGALFLPFLVSSFYIFILSLEGFYSQLFFSVERVEYLSIREILAQSGRIILVLFVVYFVIYSYQITGIFFLLFILYLLLLFFSLFYIKKLIPSIFQIPKAGIDKKRVRKFVGYLTVVTVASVFLFSVNPIMIGIFLMPEYVGYYTVAFSLIHGVAGLLSFPNSILLPAFTKLNSSKKKIIFNKTLKYLLSILVPSLFGLLVLGKYFIRLFFGYSYLPSVLPLYILSFLILPIICTNLFFSLFSAEEKPEVFAKPMIATCIINVVLNFLLIKSFLPFSNIMAIVGVAIATLISWFFYFFVSIRFLKKELKLKFSFEAISKPLIASLIMFFVLALSLSLMKDITLLFGIIEIILGAAVYLIVMLAIKGFTKEDLDLIKILIKKK